MIWNRIYNKVHRLLLSNLACQNFKLDTPHPYISFTFDDFPRTSLINGARILSQHGLKGTYYVSMGLLGKESPCGPIATLSDLEDLLEQGHEIGCHTFDHLDAQSVTSAAFVESIMRNSVAYARLFPDHRLATFAYPIDGPTLKVKRIVGRHFLCCRGGGQSLNKGVIDLNLLRSFFLDWRIHENIGLVEEIIERNHAIKGWLIFSTHDVRSHPSRYGCDPSFFEEVVCMAVRSGARVLCVSNVCRELGLD